MSSPNTDPLRSPGGSRALDALGTGPGRVAARDRLTVSIRAIGLLAYGRQVRCRVAESQENR